MSGNLRDLIDGEAELDDEEDDESFDEDEEGSNKAGRRDRPPPVDDSSEEEDDDDEDELQRVRENFIVDEDDEDEEEGEDEAARKRRRNKKRRRAEREEEAQLDDEDLDLIGESRPDWERKSETQSKFKRLKRGHRDDEERTTSRRDLTQIFEDDDEDQVEERHYGRPSHRGPADEFDDFIEDDYPEDEEERNQRQEDLEVARPRDRGLVVDTTGLDKEALDDFEAIFGHGEDYEWALQAEEDEEERQREEQNLELKDVFEPAQLKEKLMTDEDNDIRFTDEPERFQIDRKPYKNLQLTPEQFKEEARWISKLMWPKKQLPSDLKSTFNKTVAKVLEFFVVDEMEVPFVFQHRKDYLIHATARANERDPDSLEIKADKLLIQDDLWRILELDIRFRSLIEKRNAIEKTFDNLKSLGVDDETIEEMLYQAETMEELQDLQDYMQFQYATQLKDLAATGAMSQETKRPGARSASGYERIRNSRVYGFVKAYGITPDRLALNALGEGKKVTAEDDQRLPIDLADSLTDDYFDTGDAVITAARQMYAEEAFVSPRLRKHFRLSYYMMGTVSCRRTEKGLRRIDEAHPFYEIKYLINQTIGDLARRPEIFLKMMKAEEEGLVEVRLTLQNEREFRRELFSEFQSDNFSERADAWNEERRRALDMALPKLERIITKGVKDSLRTACQDELLKTCRDEFSKRLDQAPYKPKGLVLGTTPRCLVVSNGMADPGRDLVCWAYVEEDGRAVEQGKFGNLGRDEEQRAAFCELVERRRPDVIGVSGYSAETARLVRDLEELVRDKGLMGNEFDDPETDEMRSELLEVVVVNDEVARLWKDSPRAIKEHPTLNPVTRYCLALARYLQNPLKEYALLGRDMTSLAIHPCQGLLPQDRLFKYLETAMVDMVNLCGVDINEAMADAYTANLLQYVAGLGPRKSTAVVKAINANGGVVNSRAELVGDPDSGKLPVVGPRVWNNCASFLFIDYDATSPASDPLDSTRVHPEDYELGRKMAADALELDEEDVKAEVEENGAGAIVRKLFKDQSQDKVNELILEEYAEQLERQYHQRKRATLYTIRGELQGPYEELRHPFFPLGPDEIFTMFTGETRETLCEHMTVPVNVRVVKDDFAIVRLDCGIEGRIDAMDVSARQTVREVLQPGQTTRAVVLEVDRRAFVCKLSMREDMMRRPFRRRHDHERDDAWDAALEDRDRDELTEKNSVTGRAQRVIKHPLFRPYNSTQAEEYLGSRAPGEVVIRPSSKGNDHLAVTWKVADGVYQHVDVLELDKENEFSLGRTLKVANKHTYQDLDELIVEHINAMSRKVDEMKQHEKFQKGSKAELERWLTTYMDANPTRSSYAFCLDTKHPGYFFLCFKASRSAKVGSWSVRVVPHAYEMMNTLYPDMRALCNGFKIRWQNELLKMQANSMRGGPPSHHSIPQRPR